MQNRYLIALVASLGVAAAANANTLTFDSAFASGSTFFAGTEGEVLVTYSGSQTGVFAGDQGGVAVFPNDPTAPFFSVSASGTATFAYKYDQKYLSLDWGTQDNYNRIKLQLNGSDVATIAGVGDGSTASFFSTSSYVFDTVVFYNDPTINSFEFDNVKTVAVPDGGATLALFGLGFALLGLVKRKVS